MVAGARMAKKKPSRRPSRPLIEDACAACDRPIWVKFAWWPMVNGRLALLECANLCSDECEEYAHIEPDVIVARLRARKSREAARALRARTCR